MRKILLLLMAIFCFAVTSSAKYTDHRFHNVDSLEVVMSRLTAEDIAHADENALRHIASDLEELMWGFNQTNGVKSEYYARMLLGIAQRMDWPFKIQSAAKAIGQHFWAQERYDSAAFYYSMAMSAVREKEEEGEDVDDALSQMYGTLGNLYSMMDSISVAMDYYEKAGVLFKKHGWHNSSAVLYYNMGETMRYEGELKKAQQYYQEGLEYSLLAGDSLAIATAYKGLGSLYMQMGKTYKALKCLDKANAYFADHEKEELQYRMESLDYTGQVLALQNRRRMMVVVLLLALIGMVAAVLSVFFMLRRTRREKAELAEVLEDSVETIGASSPKSAISLKPREQEVLDLISKGYTNAQVAEAVNLSPETVKWYKKKLFAMFEVSNSAELVKVAKDDGIL